MRTTIFFRRITILLLTLLIITIPTLPNAHAAAAMAMGYTPKYIKDFQHFDYVNPDAPQGGKLILYGFGTFDSMNPFVVKGISAAQLGLLVFETLTEKSLDEPFSAYGLLADDMVLADDKLSITFHLNPQATFSDGSPVLAEDVKFSFDTLMGQKAHPQYRFYYNDVKQVVVTGKRSVRFEFKRANPELHMIVGDIPVFSKKWLGDKSFDELDEVKPISTGPYIVDNYDLGKSITYKKNPDYWAKNLPVRRGMFNFDEIVIKYYKDSTVAQEAFKAGEFQFFHESHSKRWARDHVGPKYDSGEIVKHELKHKNNAGMQGFVFNTRRPLFKDKRVRRAITLAMDFEWSNQKLFYDQYTRCDSYFSNSEMAASGLPKGKELGLLNKYREQLSDEIFNTEWTVPTTKKPSSLRKNLRQAKKLLKQAGWTVKDGHLMSAKGERFEFSVLLAQKGFERIMAPFARNLKKLGITMNYRTVDASLYRRRSDKFDFDMTVDSFAQSQSPGNELMGLFHSSAADQDGSRNSPGIKHPVVDKLVEEVISAKDREQLIIAVRALDRVLLHQDYLVPNWYINKHRVAYRSIFGMPETTPLYYDPENWMIKTWWKK